MNDIEKVKRLFDDAFNAGASAQRLNWDMEQMRQVTQSTMLHELMEILKGAYPSMEFDSKGELSSIVPIWNLYEP